MIHSRWMRSAALLIFCLFVFALTAAAQDEGKWIPVTATVTARATFSPDASLAVIYETGIFQESIISSPSDIALRVYDMESSEQIAELNSATDYANSIVFSNDGSFFVSTHTNGQIVVWDTAALEPLRSGRLPFMSLEGLALLNEDTLIGRGVGYPTPFLLVDLETLTLSGGWSRPFDTYLEVMEFVRGGAMATGYIGYITGALSPDNTMFVMANQAGLISVYDLATQTWTDLYTIDPDNLLQPRFDVRDIQFTSDGDAIYYHALDEMTYRLDLDTLQTTPLIPGGAMFALSPDGTQIAYVRQAETDVYLASLSGGDPVLLGSMPLAARNPTMTSLAFSPDGSLLYVGGLPDIASTESVIVVFATS